MGINATVVRQADGEWLFTWAPGTPPYSVWLNGIEVGTGLAVESFVQDGGLFPDEAPPLEILNSGDPIESELFPPFVTPQWRGLQSAAAYVVDQFIGGSGGSFLPFANVMERATGYYSWDSGPLDDGDNHQFRVTALSAAGAEGVPLAFDITMARNPAPPDVALEINSAGDLVVSAA